MVVSGTLRSFVPEAAHNGKSHNSGTQLSINEDQIHTAAAASVGHNNMKLQRRPAIRRKKIS